MLIAQITDIHLGIARAPNPDLNAARLEAVLAEIKSQIRQPDLVIVTGDLADDGRPEIYASLAEQIKSWPWPSYVMMGNHDRRAAFRAAFPDYPAPSGFIQYEIDRPELRILLLDSLTEGLHGGSFCPARARWLEERLSEKPDKPTLLALHHPPVPIQIPWMSMPKGAEWAERLRAIVDRHKQIIHIMAGHIHRPIFTRFSHTTVSVAPATAPQVALELADLDPNIPDNRPMLIEERPGYALHHFDGEKITTHIGFSPVGKIVVSYDERHSWLPALTMDLDKPG